jgi:hypothetical protein
MKVRILGNILVIIQMPGGMKGVAIDDQDE